MYNMHRCPLLLWCAIVIISCSCTKALTDTEQMKQDIIKSGYDTSAQFLKLIYKKNNVLFSPFGIRSALALLHLGADGETRDEIARILGLPSDAAKMQQAHAILNQTMSEVENTGKVEHLNLGNRKAPRSRLNKKTFLATDICNAKGIFVQDGIELLPRYESQVQSLYKGEVIKVDFHGQPSKATDTINGFVSKHTKGMIPKLFRSPLDSDTSIVMATALYFKAAWNEPFEKEETQEGTFNFGSKNTVVKFMRKVENMPYIKIANLQLEAVSLSYKGNNVSAFFVLPYGNQTLDAVVSSLNGDTLKRIALESKFAYVDLRIPQMKYKWSQDIDDTLRKLGVKQLFGDEAKLHNMIRQRDVDFKVSKVSHAAEIEINESGTEASAVTVVEIVSKMGHFYDDEPIHFHLDRPFLMFVHHRHTQTILFAGTVHNPNGSVS